MKNLLCKEDFDRERRRKCTSLRGITREMTENLERIIMRVRYVYKREMSLNLSTLALSTVSSSLRVVELAFSIVSGRPKTCSKLK